MHFGVITPPVSGHLHPFGALGRELMARGHRVTVFHMNDLREPVQKEGLQFVAIGGSEYPHGSLGVTLAKLTRRHGRGALRFTIKAIRSTTEMFCREAPAAIGKVGVDALLVDQTEPAGASIAERLGIPFITVCNALLLHREPDMPPPFTSWTYSGTATSRLRHRVGYASLDRAMKPITRTVAKYRKRWGLPPQRHWEDSFSGLLQIGQQPQSFDFPRRDLPSCFHYVGPLRRESNDAIPFPWDKLDGRPVVYAPLTALQNDKQRICQCFAEACSQLDVQLVMAHGGGLDAAAASSLPGKVLAVPYVPHLEVLSHARLTLADAGLNTVLDSLSCGVPLVTVPVTYEQPSIASRVAWTGTGRVLELSQLDPVILRSHISEVLNSRTYTKNAQGVQRSISEAGGVKRAAHLIEEALAVC